MGKENLEEWTPYEITELENLLPVTQETLERVRGNYLDNPKTQLFNYGTEIGLPRTTVEMIKREQELAVPEERKLLLERFRKIPFESTVWEPELTFKRINPFTAFEKSPPLYFGIGGGSKMPCKGLPFDVLAMILAGEYLRRELKLGKGYILLADRITYTNIGKTTDFTKEAIDKILGGERDLLRIILRKLGIDDFWQVFLQTDLEEIVGPELKKDYEDFIQNADTFDFVGGHHYSIEMADIKTLVGRQQLGGVKLGWFIRKPERCSGGFGYIMDEQPFDARYIYLMAYQNLPNTTSFAYVKSGMRLIGKGGIEKAPPYICYYPERRLLLSPLERPIEKLAVATKAGGGFRYEWARQFFGGIASLFEKLILREEIPVSGKQGFREQAKAEKIDFILKYIFDGSEVEAENIWKKTFPTAL